MRYDNDTGDCPSTRRRTVDTASSDNDRKARAVPEMREAFVERMKDAVIGAYGQRGNHDSRVLMLFSGEKPHQKD